VVHAKSVENVSTTLRLANENRVAVVPRGAGTGVVGGSFAGTGEIVLSLADMNQILEINDVERYAVVQPGVINDRLDQELRKQGLWFAPDPASRDISTVGGNIATNAGGLMCTKYGVTREAVLSLQVVLASGEVIRIGRSTAKGVTGLDLTALMVGSEGTLGVVVEATVRVHRKVAGSVATVSGYFPSIRQAAQACSDISAASLQPMIMELLDDRALTAVHNYLKLPSAPPGSSHVLVQTDGVSAHDDAMAILAVMESCGGTASLAATEEEAAELVRIRRSLHPAMMTLGTTLIEDVCVPRSKLVEMFAAITVIENKYDIVIPVVAHAGDGNLHPNFIFDTPEPTETIWQAAGELFHAALELGGTLTGEHGVGILKRRWLGEELGDTQLKLQEEIKRVFDPHGILNPGKVFVAKPRGAQPLP
jgi:glycolate oxidase